MSFIQYLFNRLSIQVFTDYKLSVTKAALARADIFQLALWNLQSSGIDHQIIRLKV